MTRTNKFLKYTTVYFVATFYIFFNNYITVQASELTSEIKPSSVSSAEQPKTTSENSTKLTYYPNGTIKTKDVRNSAGVRIDYKSYDENGNKTSDYSYHSNGKVYEKITYHSNGKYATREKRTNTGNRTDYKKYNSKGVRVADYDYFSNGQYSKKTLYNDQGVRTEARFRNSNLTIKTKYTYYSNGNVKRKYNYNSNGVKISAHEYDTKGNRIKHWEYYSNGKVKYRYVNHYQKNGVKTGVTKTWYDKNGKVTKIDAYTYPTYYSQYTNSYKKYACPKYNGDMYKHGCIMNAMAMYYSVYHNDELTPKELYSQGYKCFFNVEQAYARNGMNVKQVDVRGNKHNVYTNFENRNNAIPNGKSTFTIKEAIVDYGMPVQLMMRSDGHISTNFPGHSVLAYRYVYEDGHSTIYAKNPGGNGSTIDLKRYMAGEYNEYNANWYQIEHAWVGGIK